MVRSWLFRILVLTLLGATGWLANVIFTDFRTDYTREKTEQRALVETVQDHDRSIKRLERVLRVNAVQRRHDSETLQAIARKLGVKVTPPPVMVDGIEIEEDSR